MHEEFVFEKYIGAKWISTGLNKQGRGMDSASCVGVAFLNLLPFGDLA